MPGRFNPSDHDALVPHPGEWPTAAACPVVGGHVTGTGAASSASIATGATDARGARRPILRSHARPFLLLAGMVVVSETAIMLFLHGYPALTVFPAALVDSALLLVFLLPSLALFLFRGANLELEQRVKKRTADLVQANERLQRMIDEGARAEKEIRESRERLRMLTARLESLREEERTRISREIHDELGQSLTALRLDLSLMSRKLRTDGLGLHSRKAESMMRLVDTILGAVKSISTELRPGVLDELGLAAALEWQAKEFEGRTEIPCTVAIRPERIDVDRGTSTALFRIVQESLTNVARHASAPRVEVRLEDTGGRLLLEVRDEGIGITREQVSDPRSLGLIGIRERVRSLGGELVVEGDTGAGTTVRVSVPTAGGRIRC